MQLSIKNVIEKYLISKRDFFHAELILELIYKTIVLGSGVKKSGKISDKFYQKIDSNGSKLIIFAARSFTGAGLK